MGNQTSQLAAAGKVILVDGSIQEIHQPTTVAELMLEYPQQVVVELKPQGGQSKPTTPLPADKALELDKLYLMVPLRRGKPARLSPEEAHNILLRANEVLGSKTLVSSSSKSLPFFARICPATSQDAYSNFAVLPRVSRREITAVASKERPMEVYNNNDKADEGFPEDHGIDERPDYLSRQLSSRGWKPKLDTIEEKKDEMMMMMKKKKKGPKVVVLAAKAVQRIESKGLVWG